MFSPQLFDTGERVYCENGNVRLVRCMFFLSPLDLYCVVCAFLIPSSSTTCYVLVVMMPNPNAESPKRLLMPLSHPSLRDRVAIVSSMFPLCAADRPRLTDSTDPGSACHHSEFSSPHQA